jgi:hypothetical protein
MFKTSNAIISAFCTSAISFATLNAGTVPVSSIHTVDDELSSFVAGGRTYTKDDLIEPILTSYTWRGDPALLVNHGESVPPPGTRTSLLTSDFRLDTGLAQLATGTGAATLTFDTPLINGVGPDLVLFEVDPDDFADGVSVRVNTRVREYAGTAFGPPMTIQWFDGYWRYGGNPNSVAEFETGTYLPGVPVFDQFQPVFGIAIDLNDFAVAHLDAVSTVSFGSLSESGPAFYDYLDPVLFMGINSAIPEPSSAVLLLLGGFSTVFLQRRRKVGAKIAIASTFVFAAICGASATHADTFGNGRHDFDIEFVTIGHPGNADTTAGPYPFYIYPEHPVGKVDYTYRMGKFEISEGMINAANTLGGLGITHGNRGANKPATRVSWIEAVHFINWLNTSTGSPPAYKFDSFGNFLLWESDDAGYDPNNLFRNSLAHYVLPSLDEWYKAAYYDPTSGGAYYDYATGSDTIPTPVASGTAADTAVYLAEGPADITQAGGLSPYGTMGQGGNVQEWGETNNALDYDISGHRWVYGGSWENQGPGSRSRSFDGNWMLTAHSDFGFRVASISEAGIPEPSTLALGAMAAVGLLMPRRALSD